MGEAAKTKDRTRLTLLMIPNMPDMPPSLWNKLQLLSKLAKKEDDRVN
jgi:hypothetical protein